MTRRPFSVYVVGPCAFLLVVWAVATVIVSVILIDQLPSTEEEADLLAGRVLQVSRAVRGKVRHFLPNDGWANSHKAKIGVETAERENVKRPQLSLVSSGRRRTRRFPKYGTPEFNQECSWTSIQKSRTSDCTFFARPQPKDNEGLAAWAARIPTAHIMAKQSGCRLFFDYGAEVDVHSVWTVQTDVTSGLGDGTDGLPYNWTVPSGFDCEYKDRCINFAPKTSHLPSVSRKVGKSLAFVPHYRYAQNGGEGHRLYREDFVQLQQNLPGFKIETSMACSFGSLVQLAPAASNYEPDLFTKILPTLQDENSLVMAVYMRVGNADQTAKQEKAGEAVDWTGKSVHVGPKQKVIDCALSLEKQHLTGDIDLGVDIKRVVWMLVSDSRAIKERVTDLYDGKDANTLLHADKQKWQSQSIQRQIVVTGSRGAHTRRGRDPSTVDFAEAAIDWHLIGESDLVIGHGGAYSFVTTAALRTARPYYNDSCSEVQLVYERGAGNNNEDVSALASMVNQRFPKYGSAEFAQLCKWTSDTGQSGPPCTILVRPRSDEHEGLALWVNNVVEGYLLARQAGCRLLLDYGEGVDITSVVKPQPFLKASHDDQLHNWKVQPGFNCTAESHCYQVKFNQASSAFKFTEEIPGRKPLAPVPKYRHAHGGKSSWLYRRDFADLERALPGFQIETGFACAMGKLLHLSPKIKLYEPRLFTELLPALEGKEALVISLYIRTGHAETGGDATPEDMAKRAKDVEKNLECALSLEQQYLSGTLNPKRSFNKIIWNVVSDSQYVKQNITHTYDKQIVNAGSGLGRSVKRQILTTSTRGAHTRAQGNPSTADFAEALIDWFLIGESDLVVAHKGWSFGVTAALRTARPIYHPYGCHISEFVGEGDVSASKQDASDLVKGSLRKNVK